jgi:pimeloyl-ACP methyl ester carboxylesterase
MPHLWLKLSAAAVLLIAWIQFSSLQPQRDSGVFQVDPPTPYVHYLPAETARGRVLVVHGLDVSKATMHFVASALADGGFEVYSIDLPGHGDSTAPFQAPFAQQAIANVVSHMGDDTIVLGHSLGAGLLMDLAENRHFSTMVLLAPPPIAISRIQADRALIATGDQDIPRILSFAEIAGDIGGSHVESWILPWAAHSGPIFNPVHVRRMVEWLGGDGTKTRTLARMVWLGVMFVSAVILGLAMMPGRRLKPLPSHIPTTLVFYVAAFAAAAAVLRFVNPLGWLRLFATDYLIGFLFSAGLILLLVNTHKDGQKYFVSFVPFCGYLPFLKAVAAAAFVVVVVGWLVASNVLHIALSDGRWWRFPFIALASLPLFVFDELAIRRIDKVWKAGVVVLTTRVLICAFVLAGILILNRESAFLLLIAPLLVFFWIALWLAAGVVHRHTQNALAAAVFAALVQGWAFAAWFVTI